MAIHIQMNEDTERELKKASFRNKLSALLSCILFILLGGGILVLVVYNVAISEPASFVSYKPKKKPNAKTTRKQASEENAIQEEASASTPAQAVIVSNSPTAVTMPMSTAIADMSDGLSADIGLDTGLGAGDLGEGMGGGGDGLGSKEGGGSTLTGTFYDLKMKKNGADSGLKGSDQVGVITALAKFFTSWNERELDKYYKSETKLYASSWYLPVASAKYGPIAYEVGDPDKDEKTWECKPSAWLAVYRGKVIAPKSGKFRFIGTGDDFLAVRFDKKTVLEAGYRAPTYFDKKNPTGCFISEGAKREAFLKERKDYEMITTVVGCNKWNGELGGLVAGKTFSVKEGEEYEIEIAITEIPGGYFGFVLFIEDVTEGKNSKAKQYDLFRTCDTNPDIDKVMKALKDAKCDAGTTKIPFNEDSWVWEVVPED